jgi:hypothetical protein
MKKSMIMSLCLIVAMALLYWAPYADGYETYDDGRGNNCKGCHGDFRANGYVSEVDGETWSDSLHNIHRNVMLGGDCDTCHLGSKSPVYLDRSDGISGINDMACLSCHGREDDSGVVTGAGLRQHHNNTKVYDCLRCHDDSDPNKYTPVGEDVLPPFYVVQDSNFANKLSDPCNPAPGYPEDYEGTATGLDNDGDGLYDGADPDCASSCTDNDRDGFSIEGDNCGIIDCDDSNPSINPDATEVCDGRDNNCDGNVDEGFDYDGDGFISCAGDCNDNDPAINPGALEICGNGFDENCDGVLACDNDRDGYTDDVDCNDNDPAINPGAPEICDDTLDNDCDGQTDLDDPDCEVICTPTGVPESVCNGIDDDCDGVIDEDYVMDDTCGLGACGSPNNTPSSCVGGVETSCQPGPQSEPVDVTCDGVDGDCDGSIDEDYTSLPTTCGLGLCASTGQTVCTGGTEGDTCTPGPQDEPTDVTCDGVDGDCDGAIDEDYVMDDTCGLGACGSPNNTPSTCVAGVETSCQPGPQSELTDVTCDGVDGDCDGSIDEDGVCGPQDEICDDGIDNDLDGKTDCSDKKDCGKDPACGGGEAAIEICDDGIDNDLDGKTDCSDKKDCGKDLACGGGEAAIEICDDGIDNDLDGKTDCSDRKDCGKYTGC